MLQNWHDALKSKIADLENRQETLQEKEVYLKALEATIESKTSLVDDLNNQVESLKDEHAFLLNSISRTKTELTKEQNRYAEKLKTIKSEFEESEIKYNEAKGKAVIKQKELNALNKEIQNRLKYQEEQEQLLDNAINEGNTVLYDLKYDITEMLDKKLEAEQKLAEAQSNLSDYILASEATKHDLQAVLDDLDIDIKAKNTELNKLKTEIDNNATTVAEVKAENDRKIMILKEHELKIQTLRDTIVKERAELETEKRRWHSLKNLYGDI